MSRKKSWLGSESSGGAPLPSGMWGLTTMSLGYISSAVGTGFPGGVDSWYVGSLVQLEEFVIGQTFFTYYFNGTSGGHLLYQIAPTLLILLIVQPGGGYATSPYYTIPTSQLKKVISVLGVVDSVAAKARIYINGIQIGSGLSITGYLPPSGIGSRIGSWTTDSTTKVYGAVYGTNPTPPTAQNVLDWHRSCKSNRKIMPMGGGYPTNGMWRIDANSAVSGAPDLIGSADFNVIAGTPSVVKTFSRFAS